MQAIRFGVAVAVMVAAAGQVQAELITYELTSLVDGGSDPGSTEYSGTGFAGMHVRVGNFISLFGFENAASPWSRTIAQVDISALAGATINSASLSYVLTNGWSSDGSLELTSWDSTGTMSFSDPSPPGAISTTSYSVNGLSTNIHDVTSIVGNRVDSGASWLGLYFSPGGPGTWGNYTWASSDSDAAQVRLTIDYTPASSPVPEPSSLALLSLGGVGMVVGAVRRRRQKTLVV